jgi:hypothetical protein
MPTSEDELEKLKRAYQILGVPLFASAPSIKQAYRQLIKRWHPDRYPSDSSLQAYSEIEHAPLRYYSGDILRPQQSVNRGNSVASGAADALRQPLSKTDRLEFWVRFVCGSFLGLFVSFRLILYAFDRLTIPAAITVASVVLGCGFGAARYGDKFWHSILKYWWLWP